MVGFLPNSFPSRVGLCIVYFKRYGTYHDTMIHMIFDMYQQYILSGFRQKKPLIYPQISQEILITKIS